MTIMPAERAILLDAARTFPVLPPAPPRRSRPAAARRRQSRRDLPGGDFDARADWAELLERHGWRYIGNDGAGKQCWCRPGKSEGTSATVNHEGNDLLHVFSSSVASLEPNRSYTKFQFVAMVEHDGNFKEAAETLRREGYGQPLLPFGSRRPNHRRRSSRRRGRRQG